MLTESQHFQEVSALDSDRSTADLKDDAAATSTNRNFLSKPPAADNEDSTIDVLLDIQKEDWQFNTQPGTPPFLR